MCTSHGKWMCLVSTGGVICLYDNFMVRLLSDISSSRPSLLLYLLNKATAGKTNPGTNATKQSTEVSTPVSKQHQPTIYIVWLLLTSSLFYLLCFRTPRGRVLPLCPTRKNSELLGNTTHISIPHPGHKNQERSS